MKAGIGSTLKLFTAMVILAAWPAVAQEAGVTSSISEADIAMYRTGINPADADVDSGMAFFIKERGEKKTSCATCHGGTSPKHGSLKGAAAAFPKWSAKAKRVVSLEDQINLCLEQGVGAEKLEQKSGAMTGISLYVRSLSKGAKVNVKTSGDAMETFELGKRVFEVRRGQRNLACATCHIDLVGTTLRMQPLAKLNGAAAHWPAYRMVNGETTQIQRRFQQCMSNARLAPFPMGDYRMVALELYVTSLANGQPVETPGWVR
ncbi:MAG: sulfur oxidation c-type cytochrome SoxA [Nitrospinae bacterium]|nr:sulfur oxidation c-type cytochrome SoxA [Nitrospinota bacterium]